ncbi:hypothetical protein CN469_13880 [Bacillus cereus]|nr:hypothetical protein CN469_13880 [Bacillus cereus]
MQIISCVLPPFLICTIIWSFIPKITVTKKETQGGISFLYIHKDNKVMNMDIYIILLLVLNTFLLYKKFS